jgi:hypothetical protein
MMRCAPIEGSGKLPTSGNGAFGARRSATHVHRGIDLARPLGTPVYAVADGEVEHAADQWEPGFTRYGGHVVVRHADGTRALYAHLDSVTVIKGRAVLAGELVGTVGRSTGTKEEPRRQSGGAHLHFEISPRAYPQGSEAERLDPVAWLARAIDVRIARALATASRATGVDVALLRAIAWVESRWDPTARSKRGGVGLFGLTEAHGINPLNPEQAAGAAAHALRLALRRFDSVASAVAAYAWSSAEVEAHPQTSSWPAAVELYVHEVLGRHADEQQGRKAVPLARAGGLDGSP